MTKQDAIKVFEEKKVRTVWDSDKEEGYFSIVDVIAVLMVPSLFMICLFPANTRIRTGPAFLLVIGLFK